MNKELPIYACSLLQEFTKISPALALYPVRIVDGDQWQEARETRYPGSPMRTLEFRYEELRPYGVNGMRSFARNYYNLSGFVSDGRNLMNRNYSETQYVQTSGADG